MISEEKPRYFVLNKPANMLSQFVGHNTGNMLGKVDFDFPEGIHAIGRLDNASEGLLILTTDKRVTKLLFQSKTPHKRTYLVQVNDTVSVANLELLRTGVPIIIKGNVIWQTSPCEVELISKPDDCYKIENKMHPNNPYCWLKITLTEGKYHQIRKMVVAVNHKCKRLIRTSIENLELGHLPVGQIQEYEKDTFFDLLKIKG